MTAKTKKRSVKKSTNEPKGKLVSSKSVKKESKKRPTEKKPTSLWIIDGQTESSDHFSYLVESAGTPSADEIDRFLSDKMPDEYRYIGFTNWVLGSAEAEELPSAEKVKSFKRQMKKWWPE